MKPRPSPSPSLPRRGWRWAALGMLAGVLFSVLAFAPARWLAAAVAGATQGRVLLANPRGTVWSGSATVVFASGNGGGDAVSLPGALDWRLRPGWGHVLAVLDVPCCAAQPIALKVVPRADGVRLDWQDSRSRWPATMLAGLGAPWNTLKLDGALDLSTRELSLELGQHSFGIAGQATLDATDVSSSLLTLRPMGSYRLTLAGGNRPSLLLSTQGGALQMNGSGTWTGSGFRFSGEAFPAPGSEDALSNFLNMIGRRDGARSIITLG